MKIIITLISALFLSSYCLVKQNSSEKGDYTRIFKLNSDNQDPLAESIKRGKTVYEDFCMQCHLPTGEGVASVYPPLAKADYLLKNRKASIHAVKYGLKGEITVNEQVYNSVMPAPGLYDDEVADVMNYILNSWGNKNPKMITEAEVKAVKE